MLDEEMLKDSKYYKQLVNDVQVRPLNSEDAPYCDITIRLGRYQTQLRCSRLTCGSDT